MSGIPEMMNTMSSCGVAACGGNKEFATSLASKIAQAPAIEQQSIESSPKGRGR